MILELDVHEAREILHAIQIHQARVPGNIILKRVEGRLNPLYEDEARKLKKGYDRVLAPHATFGCKGDGGCRVSVTETH